AKGVDLSAKKRPENLRRRFTRGDIAQEFEHKLRRQKRVLKQHPREPVRRRPGVVVHEGKSANLAQDFAQERIEFFVVGEERKDFARRPRDKERSPAVAIRMAEDRNIAAQRQPDALAYFLPD